MTIRKINYAVIAPEVEEEIKDKYTKSEADSLLNQKENITNKGKANGYASLDANNKIPLSQLPDTAKQQTYVVNSKTERDILSSLIEGDKCFEVSTGDSYIWDGTEWLITAKADWENINLQWINIIDKPTSNVSDIDSAVNKKHEHNNFNLLETITQTLLDRWNSAWDHIADSIKHITSSERTLWNTVTDKVDKVTGKQLSTNDYTDIEKNKLNNIEENANNYSHPSSHSADMITETTAKKWVSPAEKDLWNSKAEGSHTHSQLHSHSNKTVIDKITQTGTETSFDLSDFVTQDDLGDAGYGDMTKAVYDKNNDGKVDISENAEKLGGQLPSYYASKNYVDDNSGLIIP